LEIKTFLLEFEGRKWPVIFGIGGGFGMGYGNCQRLFDEPYLVRPESITVSLFFHLRPYINFALVS